MDITKNNPTFSVASAKNSFMDLLQKFVDESDSKEFLEWIHSTWPRDFNRAEEEAKAKREAAEAVLKDIALDLRKKLPQESILPSEKLFIPIKGENSDCMPECTLHVDAFLYDDDSIEELTEHGLLARNYCRDCGSRNTEPLVFISHSASKERLAYVFTTLLPPLDGLTIMDVGSRLGPSLYAAYLYTKAADIIGVEMNKDLCHVQEDIIEKYGFKERVRVVEDDVTNLSELVHSADVVMLHNVFEFFLPEAQQEAAWRFLRESVKPGAILITTPPLSTSLMNLKTGINLSSWVEELPPHNPVAAADSHWQEEAMEVTMYRVVKS